MANKTARRGKHVAKKAAPKRTVTKKMAAPSKRVSHAVATVRRTKAAPALPQTATDSTRAVVVNGMPVMVGSSRPNHESLPALLMTTAARRYVTIVTAQGWTLATVPADQLERMGWRMKVASIAALFDVAESKVRLRASELGIVLKTKSGTSRGTTPRDAAVPAVVTRTLVDDAAQAVRLDALAVGMRFKTPDSPEERLYGWEGRVMRQSMGSVTVTGAPFEYLAPSTMVVPLEG